MRRQLQPPAVQREMADRDRVILALLEERPYAARELCELFGLTTGMNMVLVALARQGQVKRLRDGRWSLATSATPAAVPSDVEAHGVDQAALEAAVDEASRPDRVPARPKRQGRAITVRPALRHPHERPPSSTIARDAAPSWWVHAPRDGFSDHARQHQARMRGSREHHQIKLKILDDERHA